MKLIGRASIIRKITGQASATRTIIGRASLKTLSPDPSGGTCPEYDLISGGSPSQVYTPINGFNLISGGTP